MSWSTNVNTLKMHHNAINGYATGSCQLGFNHVVRSSKDYFFINRSVENQTGLEKQTGMKKLEQNM